MLGVREKKSFCTCLLSLLCLACVVANSESFWLRTERSLTEKRGGNISLPCNFSVHAHAVYWYKHNFTGAPDDRALLVARDYMGITDPVSGFERFNITTDYSLTIRDIIVQDETTYSCLVYNTDLDKERGYTDLKVIVLAKPLEPYIWSCDIMSRDRCDYYVPRDNPPENITLICGVYDVRPLPDLQWIGSDGRRLNATLKTWEKDGLLTILSYTQVSMSNVDQITCQAAGEAVKGNSSMTIDMYYVHYGYDYDFYLSILLILLLSVWIGLWFFRIYRRCRQSHCSSSDYERDYGFDRFIFSTPDLSVSIWWCFISCYRRCRQSLCSSPDTERREPDGIPMTIRRNYGGELDRDTRESNWWCTCGNCPVMQSGVENLCCREIDRCREIQTNGCIIDSQEFKDVCLDRSLIDTLLTLRSKGHKIPGNIGNASYRFAACEIWSDYLHGYMDKAVRRPLPACVLTRVRQEFPDEASAYFENCGEGPEEESMSLLPNNHGNDEHSGDSCLKADSDTD